MTFNSKFDLNHKIKNATTVALPALLILIWPASNFLNTNFFEDININILSQYFLVTCLIFTVPIFLIGLVADKKNTLFLAYYILIILFFLTPVLRDVSHSVLPLKFLLVSEAGAAIGLYFFLRIIVPDRHRVRLYFIAGIYLAGVSTVQMSLNIWSELEISRDNGNATELPKEPSPVANPNIYFIILDEYGRSDQLANVLNFDNSNFENFLAEQGFSILSRSYSAYATSEYSIPSTLQMSFLEKPNKDHFSGRFSAAVFNKFRVGGYRPYVMTLGDGWKCPASFRCLQSGEEGIGLFGILEQRLLQMTPMFDVILKFKPELFGDARSTVNDLRLALLKTKLETPAFIYAHIDFPHPPYTRDEKCNARFAYGNRNVQYYSKSSRQAYIDQLLCVNREVLALISMLNEKDPSAIVILQSDHGPGFVYNRFRPDKKYRFPGTKAWYEDAAEERYAILNAWRVPNACQRRLSQTLHAVNTFKTLLSCLNLNSPPLTAGKSFWLDGQSQRFQTLRKDNRWQF